MPLFLKKEHKKATRLYFATDLHGSERSHHNLNLQSRAEKITAQSELENVITRVQD